jgi:hypothetical protein
MLILSRIALVDSSLLTLKLSNYIATTLISYSSIRPTKPIGGQCLC